MLFLLYEAICNEFIEKHLEGGWIGVNANLKIFLNKYENMMQRLPKTRLRAEYSVKGSELLPRDSSR